MFNKLLQRQLQKHLEEFDNIPQEYLQVFQDISNSYDYYEKDRKIMAHSMELSATEMIDLNAKLRKEALDSKKSSDDLIKINKELDQFAYVVSHDLKAPLRAINNLSIWIEEDLGTSAGEDILKNMQTLRGRVKRMESLIAGILEYSRVGRQVNKVESLNSGELVKETVEFLSPPEAFTVTVAENMPIVDADRTKMQQVFSNLISNAIKYHHKGTGTVVINCKRENNFYHFAVTDDGPGIDPQFHNKIFDIFQTLQARDKIESTGIGLAIVKKIIEEAGGQIWIESEVGKGSSFIFSWPEKHDNTSVPKNVNLEEITSTEDNGKEADYKTIQNSSH
jgi:light-regulated signal transduction histidine kinase (bacteriophytochrome)